MTSERILATLAPTALALALSASPAVGQDPATDRDADDRLRRIEEELERQRAANEELRRELETVQRRQFELGEGVPADGAAAPEASLAAQAGELEARYGPQGGIFSKPFLRSASRHAYLGGYMDLEYRDSQDGDRTFAQHRFVPFIYVDATDKLKFAAEIEFEYGGSDSPAGDGETKVEFAAMDYVFHEAVAFRAGAILAPLGKFNLIHDSPINDLTDRPLVNRFVIPTTLTEPGLGFFGVLPPLGDWDVRYEVYAVNGFRGLDRDGNANFSDESGLRSGRTSLKTDNNNSTAGVGRVSVSPFLGTEVGASVHAGKYDEAGDLWLVVWAIDAVIKPGRFVEALTPLELIGEFASGELERNDLARASGIPDDVWGVYGQVNWHFMIPGLVENVPWVFGEESTFTAVTRIDHVELGGNREEQITFGLNFRPIEDTVFKFDYQLDFEDWHRDAEDDEAFLFSVATYF